jgi:hypothetical protein
MSQKQKDQRRQRSETIPTDVLKVLCQQLIDQEDFQTLSLLAKTSKAHYDTCSSLLKQYRNVKIRDPHDNNNVFTAEAHKLYRRIPDVKVPIFWNWLEKQDLIYSRVNYVQIIETFMIKEFLGIEDEDDPHEYELIINHLLVNMKRFYVGRMDPNPIKDYLFNRPSYVVYRGRRIMIPNDYEFLSKINKILQNFCDMKEETAEFQRILSQLITTDEFLSS